MRRNIDGGVVRLTLQARGALERAADMVERGFPVGEVAEWLQDKAEDGEVYDSLTAVAFETLLLVQTQHLEERGE